MKTKPILFSTPMVQAILDGRKTQTRRIIDKDGWVNAITELEPVAIAAAGYNPKYQTSDIIWVRETWRMTGWNETEMLIEYKDGISSWAEIKDLMWLSKQVEKLAAKGYLRSNHETERFDVVKEIPWKPSIFMPKEACRMFLKVTDVRVERLQDISEDDAIAEGIEEVRPAPFLIRYKNYLENGYLDSPIESFKTLWQSINGKESWKRNPWVWVYEFEKIEKPGDFFK